MRLIHTSDWHLGRSFFQHPLYDEHRTFIDWFVRLAETSQADAVVIAGDIYDRAIPPTEAVEILEDALTRLAAICPTVIISGNHDSATRLGFGSGLLCSAGIHLRTSLNDIVKVIHINGRDGVDVAIYGLPYLEPDAVRTQLAADRSHESVLRAAMDQVREHHTRLPNHRSVVVAHAFITGGSVSDSERDIRVGSIGDAPSHVFDGVDYVALGHLHRPQNISLEGSTTTLRYSGTPLAYSFSEESHNKSVTVVDIDADGSVTYTEEPTPVHRRLITLRGDLEDLVTHEQYEQYTDHWVRATLTDSRRPENAMARLKSRFPWTAELAFEPMIDGQPVTALTSRADVRQTPADEIAAEFVHHVTDTPATDEERTLINAAVEQVRLSGASA